LNHGTVFRVVEFGPVVAPRNHRTDSVDYAVVMSGEIDMELDGNFVHLKAGDVLVQRGTIHNWVNHSTEPCVMAGRCCVRKVNRPIAASKALTQCRVAYNSISGSAVIPIKEVCAPSPDVIQRLKPLMEITATSGRL
jgi:hypothetical protein